MQLGINYLEAYTLAQMVDQRITSIAYRGSGIQHMHKGINRSLHSNNNGHARVEHLIQRTNELMLALHPP